MYDIRIPTITPTQVAMMAVIIVQCCKQGPWQVLISLYLLKEYWPSSVFA